MVRIVIRIIWTLYLLIIGRGGSVIVRVAIIIFHSELGHALVGLSSSAASNR